MLEVAAAITTERRGGQGAGRDAEAGDHVHLVVDDQFLRQAPRHIGHAGVVLEDQLHLLAGDGVAVLRHPQSGSRLDLAAGGGLLPGHGQDQADLEHVVLGQAQATRAQEAKGHGGFQDASLVHGGSPVWAGGTARRRPHVVGGHSERGSRQSKLGALSTSYDALR
jgi:hypothetical protein